MTRDNENSVNKKTVTVQKESVKPPNKKLLKKQKKVLSQAEIKRQELAKFEASKTVVEKLAESISKNKKISSKHNSVQSNLDAIRQKKPEAPTAKVNPVPKVKQQEPMDRSNSTTLLNARIEEKNRQAHILLKQADGIKSRMLKISGRERIKLAEALRDCYGIYLHIESKPDQWNFYDILRSYFTVAKIRIQANTPDEGLLLRYVFPAKSTKQISEYGTVLRYANDKKISKNDFIKWYTATTQTKILALARNSGADDSRDRLARANQLLLRFLDIREEWPLGVMEYPEYLAGKQVHLPDDLIFVVCRGVRRFDRGVQFDPDDPSKTQLPQADIRALIFIPPNIDLSNDILNRFARHIASDLEEFEQQLEETTEKVWANDLTAFLTERELGAAYKSADKWADRMQAAIAEDQSAFLKTRKKIQTLRRKSRE